MHKLSCAVLFLSLSIGIYGQEEPMGIEEVEVYGKFLNTSYKNVAENIEILTQKELETLPAKSIDEVLQMVSGIDLRRRGANGVQSDISVRGGTFEQVLILINGVRMNDSQTGHNSMNIPVDLSNVERIEVIKGPAARRFGNAAYAVLNIITKTSAQESVKISVEGGDFETYHLGLSSNFGSEKFTNLFQINTNSSEGYRHNTDYKINNIFYQNQLKLNNGSLNFQAGIQEKKFGANGFYASPNATEQYEETQASVVSLGLNKQLNQFKLNSNLYWRRGQDMYEYIRNKPEIYRNMHIGNNVGAEINGSYQSGLGVTGLGVDLRKEYLSSNNLGDRERFVTQIFLEHHFSLIQNRLKIIPGISWGDYGKQGNFFYPGLDVGFNINSYHKIYGNIARTHRIPSFTDLYYSSGTEQGNEDLEPENTGYAELGYRFFKNNLEAKASGFYKKTENGIDWVKNDLAEKWQAMNVGDITVKGFEIELNKNFNAFVQSVNLGYTYMDVDLKKAETYSRYAIDQLKHQLIAKLDHRIFKGLTNQLVYRYQERLDGYSYNLVDLKLNYQWNDFDMYLLINNLTNTDYTETFGVPMPKRWFNVGVNYRINFK